MIVLFRPIFAGLRTVVRAQNGKPFSGVSRNGIIAVLAHTAAYCLVRRTEASEEAIFILSHIHFYQLEFK